MYTGVFYQNWTRDFFRSIGYLIGPPSKIYEENQAKIKRLMADRITPQARPLKVLITTLHELHLRKTLKMVEKYQTCNLLTSILCFMAEKVSETSLIVSWDPASILHQDQYTINFFACTSFMDQIISILS